MFVFTIIKTYVPWIGTQEKEHRNLGGTRSQTNNEESQRL